MSTMENNATAAVMRLIQLFQTTYLTTYLTSWEQELTPAHVREKSQKLLGLIARRTSISGGDFVAVYSAVKILKPEPKVFDWTANISPCNERLDLKWSKSKQKS